MIHIKHLIRTLCEKLESINSSNTGGDTFNSAARLSMLDSAGRRLGFNISDEELAEVIDRVRIRLQKKLDGDNPNA